jgi:hypothetical protein
MKYAGLMLDTLALSYTGVLMASNLSKGRKLSYQDVRGQSLRLKLPELIQNGILDRTAVLYKPIKHSNKRDCINQGQVAISVWYNFYLGMMLAVTRRDDSYFDKSSINNLSNIPPKELASIQTRLGSLWGMTNVGSTLHGQYKVTRNVKNCEEYSTYLPIFMYPSSLEAHITERVRKYPYVLGDKAISESMAHVATIQHTEKMEESINSSEQDEECKTSENKET